MEWAPPDGIDVPKWRWRNPLEAGVSPIDDPESWPHYRHGDRGARAANRNIQSRAGSCGRARVDAAAGIDRWHAVHRRDLQGERANDTTPSHHRKQRSRASCPYAGRSGRDMARANAGRQAAHVADGGAGQQHWPDRLGASDQGRKLQSPGRAGVRCLATLRCGGRKKSMAQGWRGRTREPVCPNVL